MLQIGHALSHVENRHFKVIVCPSCSDNLDLLESVLNCLSHVVDSPRCTIGADADSDKVCQQLCVTEIDIRQPRQ